MKTVLFYIAVAVLGVTVNTLANAQVSYMYNYSQVPIAPIVQPYGGYGYQQQYNLPQPQPYAGQSNTTVINSQGKMAICQTINNVTTCF